MLYVALISLPLGLGLTYGAQSAMYAELFPASTQNRANSVGDGNAGCADGSWEEFGVHSGLCTVGKAKAQG